MENTFRRGKDLVVISRNSWATLKRGKGLYVIRFVWWRGSFLEKKHRKGFFEKRIERWGVLIGNQERTRG